MATALTQHQLEMVGAALKETAGRYATTSGVRKTTLDQLVEGASTSKTIFYKLYQTKEHLFLDVIEDWHEDMVKGAIAIIKENNGLAVEDRLCAAFFFAMKYMDERAMLRMLREDIPFMLGKIPHAMELHYHGDKKHFLDIIEACDVKFNLPNDKIVDIIQTIVYTLSFKTAVGDSYNDSISFIISSVINSILAET